MDQIISISLIKHGVITRIIPEFFKRILAILQGQSLQSRLFRGTAWSAAGAVVSQGSSLIMAMMLARILKANGFGWFVLVQSTSIMLQNVGSLGMGLATTRHVAGLRDLRPQQAGDTICFAIVFILASGLVLTCLMLIMPLGLVRMVMGPSVPVDLIRMVGLLAFLGMINRIQADILVGLEAFSTTAVVSLVRGLLTLILGVSGAYIYGLTGAVIGLAGAYLVAAVIGQILVRYRCASYKIHLAWSDQASHRQIIGTSLYVTASTVSITVAWWVLNIVLARQTNGLVELAIYNAADRWCSAILFLPGLIAQVSLPLFAHTSTHTADKGCKRLLLGTAVCNLIVTAIPSLTVSALSGPLMASFGLAFVPGRLVLVVLALSCLPTSINMVGSYCLWATGRTATMLGLDLMRVSIMLGYCMSAGPLVARDVAVANLLGYLLTTSMMALVLFRSGRPAQALA